MTAPDKPMSAEEFCHAIWEASTPEARQLVKQRDAAIRADERAKVLAIIAAYGAGNPSGTKHAAILVDRVRQSATPSARREGE